MDTHHLFEHCQGFRCPGQWNILIGTPILTLSADLEGRYGQAEPENAMVMCDARHVDVDFAFLAASISQFCKSL